MNDSPSRCPARPRRRARSGTWTALLALLAALCAAGMAAASPADRIKREQTLETMRQLLAALVGSGDSSGYVADMGQLPTSLPALAAAVPTTVDPLRPLFALLAGGVGIGYRGPYLPRAAGASQNFVDAWGTPIQLLSSSGTVQLQSAGPDRNLATTTDNLLYPTSPRPTHGTLEVKLECTTTGSATVAPCAVGDASVTVHFASGGTQSTSTAPSSGAATYSFPNLHIGSHYVVANAVVPLLWDVASASDVVVVRGRKASAWLRLTRKSVPAEEDEDEEEDDDDDVDAICHNPKAKKPKTLYVAPSARKRHLAHGDLEGVCPADDKLNAICHRPYSWFRRTLQVSDSSRKTHLKHGDKDGACSW